MVWVKSRDVGDVKDKFCRQYGYQWTLEDGINEWIKRDLGVDDE